MMKKLYLLLLFFLPLLLQAQDKLPGNIFLHTLRNGLDVLVVEDNSVPLATVMITFKGGVITESENTNGLNELYMRMFLNANKDINNQQDVGYHAGQLGIVSWNTSVTDEFGEYYFTLPKTKLEEGLNFMNSGVRFPKMDPTEFQSAKEMITEQLKENQSTQYYRLNDAMLHHLWGGLYNRRRPGTDKVILSATLHSIDSIKTKYYYPNNALLVVAGDVKHDEVFSLAEKIYGDWQASGFDPFKKWPIPEFKPLTRSDYFIVESPLSTSPVILINCQGPDTRNDIASTYAADVFSYIVNQNSSKLNQALVQSGLAYAVGIGYLTLKHVGPISLFVRPNPLRIKECVAEISKQIALMDNDDYLTDDLIETAKRTLEIKKLRQEEITSDYTHVLSFWWACASLNYFTGYNNQLANVSKEQLKTYVRKYIKNKPYCAGLLISPDLKARVNADSFFTSNN
jgi:zinc protease